MIVKTATVHWEGQGPKGTGKITTETGSLEAYPYGFGSRFEDDKKGSNPEELLAAAHAACFTMAFSFVCDKAGFSTDEIETSAEVQLAKKGEGYVIDRIGLRLVAHIPGMEEGMFQTLAQQAKHDCPLSKALASVPEITLSATLRTVLLG